jgi:monoamine oxidase
MNSNTYDIIIIGAGMAGLYTALNLVKRLPKRRICLVDKYKFIGGRAFTYKGTIDGVPYQWEEGGARISTKHTLLMGLLKKYGLTTIPIEGASKYKESGAHPIEAPLFDECRAIFLEPLEHLPESTLGQTTILRLLRSFVKPAVLATFLNRYPYRAEFSTLRADLALRVFREEFGPQEKYVVCKEGLSELVARMQAEFLERGGTQLLQHELVEMQDNTHAVFKKGASSEGEGRPDIVLEADKFVFALPSEALKRLPVFRGWETLKHIVMKPLLRVFAAFPPGPNKKQWFQDLPKITTAQAPRFIIPQSIENGSIQISYTDSEDAEPLMRILDEQDGETKLGKKLIEDLRVLFGDRTIPDPLFVKAYAWKEGVSYWRPGTYDPYEESRRAIRPFPKERPGWVVCGESFSVHQCWIEGALEHAREAVEHLLRNH